MDTSAEDHRQIRHLLGAYVLDDLAPDEHTAVLAHLDGCPECRQEERELREVAELLPLADPAHLDDPVVPPSWLVDRVVADVGSQRRRRRLVSGMMAAAAALVVVVAVSVGFLAGSDDDGGDDDVVPISFQDTATGIEAEGGIEGKPWGTVVHLTAEGLDAGQVYNAWLARPDGSRVSAGTFRPDEGRNIRCYLSAALAVGEAAEFGVSTPDGKTVLLAALG